MADDLVPHVLTGQRVLITAQRRATELAAALERRGAEIVHAPVLSIIPHVDDAKLLAATRALIADPPQIVVVTTGVGLRGWIEAADAAGVAHELMAVLEASRIVARGPKARGALQAAGLTADFVAESETSAEIRDLLLTEGVAGMRVAVQYHGSGADGIDDDLRTAGADVVPLVVYRWGPPPDPSLVLRSVELVARREVEAIVFTSAPGAAAFLDAVRGLGLFAEVVDACTRPSGVPDARAGSTTVAMVGSDLDPVLVAAVGPITAEPLRHAGIEPIVPDRFRLGALIREIVQSLAARQGEPLLTAAGRLRVLRRTALLDGEVLALSPSSLAVLRALADAKGAVVARPALLAALPGQSVDAHAVEVAVARLRESLGRPELVETVVKRGYRLRMTDA